MERIEKTLLLPLLAAAVLSSASCSDDKEKEPPVRAVNYTIEFTTVSQAVYLGDKYQTGDGNYRLTLTNADGDVLEADLTSVKAPKPSAAMPEAGVYTAAETRRAGTFAPEASSWETAKSGVEVRSANQAGQKKKFAIRAGSMTLAPAASGDGTFTLSGEVTDGDKTALSFSWSGALAFANESGEEDPVVYERLSMVFGDYYPDDYGIAADTYMLRGGNERVELHSQLRSVPAADPAAPLPGDGKYTIDLRLGSGKIRQRNLHVPLRLHLPERPGRRHLLENRRSHLRRHVGIVHRLDRRRKLEDRGNAPRRRGRRDVFVHLHRKTRIQKLIPKYVTTYANLQKITAPDRRAGPDGLRRMQQRRQ